MDKYNASVLSAAVWIFAVGRQVYEREEDLTPASPGKGKSLWNDSAEFSKKRWTFWKSRFGEVAGMEELTEEVEGCCQGSGGEDGGD